MVDERAHLELADRHIREANDRIANQEALILSLTTDGHDTAVAEAILQTFRETLVGFRDHRLLIVAELERLAAKADPVDPA